MVNGSANDVGIYLDSGSDDNNGSGNIFHNCGSNIVDSGSGNTINKIGGGTF